MIDEPIAALRKNRPWWTGRRFRNITPPKVHIGPVRIARWLWSRIRAKPLQVGIDVPHNHILSRDEATDALNKALRSGSDFITWLGHCAFLIRLDKTLVLTDPFLEGNCGPRICRGLERLPMPFDAHDLNPDVVLVSHSHFDHLHGPSIRKLKDKSVPIICPLKVGKRVRKEGFENITELDWFDETDRGGLRITALPAHHYSEMHLSKTLWAGFKLQSKSTGKTIYFSGDTGYSSIFKDYVAAYGPFDAACIGVGCYFMDSPISQAHFVHTNPAEAMRIASEINAKRVFGMHWGTVNGTDENQMEIPSLLQKASVDVNIPAQTLRIGQTVFL